jgi:hypothetical protein
LPADRVTASGYRGAEQDAFWPPLLPLQFQFHGLLPLPPTPEAVPAEHKPLDGLLWVATPFALPQAPLTSNLAEHCCVCPPFRPVQLQLQGPVSLTTTPCRRCTDWRSAPWSDERRSPCRIGR